MAGGNGGAPGEPAQREVLRAAYRRAGVDPSAVQYVELHGTGTVVGDPIEAAALGAALGRAKSTPLLVGSAKTNIGHLEGAAGIAGFIKGVLCVRNRAVPRSLNFTAPNPDIPLEELNLRVVTETRTWDRPVVVGVSSFGMGGTNAHAVLAEGPFQDGPPRREAPRPLVWVVSGRTAEALRAQAARLGEADADPADIAFSLATTRTAFDRRAAVVGETRDDLRDGMAGPILRLHVSAELARVDRELHVVEVPRAEPVEGVGRAPGHGRRHAIRRVQPVAVAQVHAGLLEPVRILGR